MRLRPSTGIRLETRRNPGQRGKRFYLKPDLNGHVIPKDLTTRDPYVSVKPMFLGPNNGTTVP